ncbi:MAG: hypothetical protein ABH834_05435 [Candidatus Altiarchaeota archaeon]
MSSLIDCSKRDDREKNRGLPSCRSQVVCEQCPSFMQWSTSGMPAEEWIEIRGYSLAMKPSSIFK